MMKSMFESTTLQQASYKVYLRMLRLICRMNQSSMLKCGLKPTLGEGCSVSGARILVHGNPQPQGSSDKSYERPSSEKSAQLPVKRRSGEKKVLVLL